MTIARTLRTVRHLSPAQILWRLRSRALAPWFASGFYARHGLDDAPPATLRPGPALWPGDPVNGRRLLDGRIRLLGREWPFGTPPDWSPAGASPLWLFTLHYFEWLADLRALGTAAATCRARILVADWIAAHPRPGTPPWHPYPLSLRLHAWLVHAPFLLDGADGAFQAAFRQSLARQARHLPRVLERDLGGNHLLKNLKALLAAAICLDGSPAAIDRAAEAFRRALAHQLLADGFHEERSPAYHVQVLGDVLDAQALLESTGRDAAPLAAQARRMAAALAVVRLGDGGLALFNDGGVGDPAVLAAIDTRSGHGAAADSLPAAGYYRLAAGPAIVVADAGPVGPDHLPAHAHADTLSFEMSVGAARLIVNGGTYAYQDAAWRNRLRGTAAHSTVAIDGEDSAEVYDVFRVGRRPRDVGGRIVRTVDGVVFEGHHDGYRHLGIVHRRRLALSAAGDRLDGEDRIDGTAKGHRATARFHLHSAVRARLGDDGAVRLMLPDGDRWRFTSPTAAPRLEPSVHAPRFHEMHETRQVTLAAPINGIARWSLVRES